MCDIRHFNKESQHSMQVMLSREEFKIGDQVEVIGYPDKIGKIKEQRENHWKVEFDQGGKKIVEILPSKDLKLAQDDLEVN